MCVCVPVCFPGYLQRGSLVLPRKQAPKGQMTEGKGPFYLQSSFKHRSASFYLEKHTYQTEVRAFY